MPSATQPPSWRSNSAIEHEVKPPLPYTGTRSRHGPSSWASGTSRSFAFRSQRATSTAEIAIDAIPGRPRLRVAHHRRPRGRHRHGVHPPDGGLERLADHARSRGIRVRPAEPDGVTAGHLGHDERRVGPLERAVGLGRLGGHAIGRDRDALDARRGSGPDGRQAAHTSSRMRLPRTVVAMRARSGSPRASDSAKWSACFAVIFGGSGGSRGSTTPSTITGPGVASASSRIAPHCRGSSIVKPAPPQARANCAKSIGCRSHTYSGLPRNTICSHLIWPSVLFLTITTFTGSPYFTHVRNSPISIVKPPSPTKATTCRPGYAICAAIA